MANRHFGNLGDVWKHLPLAAILELERPARYWESHSGSASYPMRADPPRAYGVLTYLAQAPADPLLAGAAYTRLLDAHRASDGTLIDYPGSALIALEILGGAARYLFCDLDGASLDDLGAMGAALGLPPEAVQTVWADGLSTLTQAAARLDPAQAARTLALIDPFRPLEPGADGRHALDVFGTLAGRGIPAVLWYGYRTAAERAALWAAVARASIDAAWAGQIDLAEEHDPLPDGAGLLGCGLLGACLRPETVAACEALGAALAGAYTHARFPDGTSGALRFTTCRL